MYLLHMNANKSKETRVKEVPFSCKNPTKKPAKYLFCDSNAALVRHSQAQKMHLDQL